MDIFCRSYEPKLGDTILDIGAGCGTEASYFSTAVGKSGHVYAIEADPHVFRRLEKTINLIGATNMTALNLAIYSKSTHVWVNMVSSAGVGNFVSSTKGSNAVKIKGYSFDDLIASLQLKDINFVKMNIEGAEREALIGLKDFSETVENWCISCHDFIGDDYETFEFVYKWLERNNYKVHHFPNSSEPYKNFYLYGTKS
jgi:FkbM family methyltransferase